MKVYASIANEIVSFRSEDNWRAVYSNSRIGRECVLNLLEENEVVKLEDGNEVPVTWEDDIIPVWGNEPTIALPDDDFEEVVSSTQKQIKKWCEEKIVEGIDIDLGLESEDGEPLGVLHYSLSERHQTDMRDLAGLIQQGQQFVTWRDDSRVSHMIYTAEQFMMLYQAATAHMLKCRLWSDALEELLFSYKEDEIEKVKCMDWNMPVPPDILDRMNELLQVMLGTAKLSEE